MNANLVKDILGNFAFLFVGVNIIVGVIMMIGAVLLITLDSLHIIILGLYTAAFATIVLGLEVYPVKSKQKKFLYRYLGFIYSLPGRGAFYILVGLFNVGYRVVQNVLGAVVAVIGLVYIVLAIVETPNLPQSMIPPCPDSGNPEESVPIFHASHED